MEKRSYRELGVALVGLPASGKTSSGVLLADLLGMPFVDLDERVEREAGRSIPALFEDEGEDGFRRRERVALERVAAGVAAGEPVVLATGGGTVELPENRSVLRERFVTVWIKVDPAAAAARSLGSGRPLLSGDVEAGLRRLYERRRAWYDECAAIAVQSDGMRPAMLAEAIREALR
ncbi:MAG TPA: shikimate kinase [Spirochaetales bacterium]|nr:shikimate kinase [Spirochaetales bacterium]